MDMSILNPSFPVPAVYPELIPRTLDVSVSTINQGLGLTLTTEQLVDLLKGMQLSAAPSSSSSSSEAGSIVLQVPPTRSDILHACDVVEDVAIAYGYNNIPKRVRHLGEGGGGGGGDSTKTRPQQLQC